MGKVTSTDLSYRWIVHSKSGDIEFKHLKSAVNFMNENGNIVKYRDARYLFAGRENRTVDYYSCSLERITVLSKTGQRV